MLKRQTTETTKRSLFEEETPTQAQWKSPHHLHSHGQSDGDDHELDFEAVPITAVATLPTAASSHDGEQAPATGSINVPRRKHNTMPARSEALDTSPDRNLASLGHAKHGTVTSLRHGPPIDGFENSATGINPKKLTAPVSASTANLPMAGPLGTGGMGIGMLTSAATALKKLTRVSTLPVAGITQKGQVESMRRQTSLDAFPAPNATNTAVVQELLLYAARLYEVLTGICQPIDPAAAMTLAFLSDACFDVDAGLRFTLDLLHEHDVVDHANNNRNKNIEEKKPSEESSNSRLHLTELEHGQAPTEIFSTDIEDNNEDNKVNRKDNRGSELGEFGKLLERTATEASNRMLILGTDKERLYKLARYIKPLDFSNNDLEGKRLEADNEETPKQELTGSYEPGTFENAFYNLSIAFENLASLASAYANNFYKKSGIFKIESKKIEITAETKFTILNMFRKVAKEAGTRVVHPDFVGFGFTAYRSFNKAFQLLYEFKSLWGDCFKREVTTLDWETYMPSLMKARKIAPLISDSKKVQTFLVFNKREYIDVDPVNKQRLFNLDRALATTSLLSSDKENATCSKFIEQMEKVLFEKLCVDGATINFEALLEFQSKNQTRDSLTLRGSLRQPPLLGAGKSRFQERMRAKREKKLVVSQQTEVSGFDSDSNSH